MIETFQEIILFIKDNIAFFLTMFAGIMIAKAKKFAAH